VLAGGCPAPPLVDPLSCRRRRTSSWSCVSLDALIANFLSEFAVANPAALFISVANDCNRPSCVCPNTSTASAISRRCSSPYKASRALTSESWLSFLTILRSSLAFCSSATTELLAKPPPFFFPPRKVNSVKVSSPSSVVGYKTVAG
jgi:hypothetical protein